MDYWPEQFRPIRNYWPEQFRAISDYWLRGFRAFTSSILKDPLHPQHTIKIKNNKGQRLRDSNQIELVLRKSQLKCDSHVIRNHIPIWTRKSSILFISAQFYTFGQPESFILWKQYILLQYQVLLAAK